MRCHSIAAFAEIRCVTLLLMLYMHLFDARSFLLAGVVAVVILPGTSLAVVCTKRILCMTLDHVPNTWLMRVMFTEIGLVLLDTVQDV